VRWPQAITVTGVRWPWWMSWSPSTGRRRTGIKQRSLARRRTWPGGCGQGPTALRWRSERRTSAFGALTGARRTRARTPTVQAAPTDPPAESGRVRPRVSLGQSASCAGNGGLVLAARRTVSSASRAGLTGQVEGSGVRRPYPSPRSLAERTEASQLMPSIRATAARSIDRTSRMTGRGGGGGGGARQNRSRVRAPGAPSGHAARRSGCSAGSAEQEAAEPQRARRRHRTRGVTRCSHGSPRAR
jgi:hypothetical protein